MKFSPFVYYNFIPDLDKNPPKCLYVHVNYIYSVYCWTERKARARHDKAAFLFITGNKRGLWPRQPRSPPPPLMMMTLKSIQPSSCWTFSVCCLCPFSLFPSLLDFSSFTRSTETNIWHLHHIELYQQLLLPHFDKWQIYTGCASDDLFFFMHSDSLNLSCP